MAKLVVIFFVNFWLLLAIAQDKNLASSETDVRTLAHEELQRQNPSVEAKNLKESKAKELQKSRDKKSPRQNAIEPAPAADPGQPPSIMLPLHDPYKPVSLRPWLWRFDIGLSTQKIPVTKPGFVIGRESLSELGSLPFLHLSFGFARTQTWGDWGFSLITATTTKSEDIKSSAGLPIRANIQYLSYGGEPFVTKRWNNYLGTTLAFQYELVSVAQTSAQSDFARWSRNYSSSNARLGMNLYLAETQALTLSFLDKSSSLGRDTAWLMSYGVQW